MRLKTHSLNPLLSLVWIVMVLLAIGVSACDAPTGDGRSVVEDYNRYTTTFDLGDNCVSLGKDRVALCSANIDSAKCVVAFSPLDTRAGVSVTCNWK